MASDISNNYPAKNDPQSQQDDANINKNENTDSSGVNTQKNVSGPKNASDPKVQDVAVNRIQSLQWIILHSIHEWTISLAPSNTPINAAAFARYVKEGAIHQNEIDELKSLEKKSEEKREHQTEILEEDIHHKEDFPIKPIDIQYYDAA